ncbi:MAG: methyltransferase domain-containing protein [Burkholderiales bacterium]
MKSKTGHETLHAYYREQAVLPTHGGFRSPAELQAYEKQRRWLFTDKLYLPPRVFDGAKLLEYGPDSGENALVFATWGARCTLVEPNPKAHPAIKDYFERFRLSGRLAGLEQADIAGYAQRKGALEKFDIIDAEGFIYTVKPDALWMDLFARQLESGGLAVIFYYEKFGSFLELLPKVIQAQYRRLTGAPSLDAAQALFAAKWASIPHKRPMQSWVMDVLENPFVRLRYFYEPQDLCRKMQEKGFTLYSSWPSYKDGLDVHWFKKTLSAEERLRSQDDFIARSRLSHMFGRKLFLLHIEPGWEQALSGLLDATDALIDGFDKELAEQCVRYLTTIEAIVDSGAVMADAADKSAVFATLRSLQRIFALLAEGRAKELAAYCNEDAAFLGAWGMPSHFAVFRYEPAENT